jgi:deoxyribodipyrimidine photo-lyase
MSIHKPKILIWFRNDLRLHDHLALTKALQKNAEILPCYCFDERHFQATCLGFPKTDKFRATFMIESVADLRRNLETKGSGLIVRVGIPEEEIFILANSWGADAVYTSKEVTTEEVQIEEDIEIKLWKNHQNFRTFWQSTLHCIEDLPFPIQNLPDVFTQYRKEIERSVEVNACLPSPDSLPPISKEIPQGSIPTLKQLGFNESKESSLLEPIFKGGESEGLKRLETYIWQKNLLKDYKNTRDGLLGLDYSTKLSPWLAQGCISPRKVYEYIKQYETEVMANESTYWLVFELLWRDYFRFVAKKYGNKIFRKNGIKPCPNLNFKEDYKLFSIWQKGQTGIPFIDANMRELDTTGFMSNRGRQNVASFLVKDLGINWVWGAMYFESKLIDYDVCSNWGNWNYIAGVGNDPRENRYFNILSQAKRYDSKGEFVKYWIPQLSNIPPQMIHTPQLLNTDEQNSYQCKIGKDYPKPIINTQKWKNTDTKADKFA